MGKRYTFADFVEVIKALRAENGCPWDRAQTHNSLRPCMTEEAAELLAAIRIYEKTGDAENMQEELGDVLLQVVLHSTIAEEEGIFTIDDVIETVYEKMIRRHPHVFGSENADTSEKVLVNWEEIKKKEKEGKAWVKSPLREIPQELPALARASKIVKKVDKLYGLPDSEEDSFREAKEMLEWMEQNKNHSNPEEFTKRYTDLLWRICEIGYHNGQMPEQQLEDYIAEKVDYFEPDYE